MKLVAIAGCSGSGKTALARALAGRLASCVCVTLDAYYRAQSHLPREHRALQNYDHPDALEWPLLVKHLRRLLRGESVETPVYLFEEHTRAPHTEPLRPADVVVVEGILALHHPAVRGLAHLRVFVDANTHTCLARRLRRDVHERGRSQDSVLRQYRQTVWPMAERYVLPSRQHADLIVSGERPVEEAVQAVLAGLRGC
jgi:uridine kinase